MTLSFRQSETGNMVCLPLTPLIGNAIFRYLTEERPDVKNNFVFIRQLAPFEPFADHSSCYEVVRRVFSKAGNLRKDITENWSMQHANKSNTGDRSWISPIREFGRYLQRIGLKDAYSR